MSLWYVFVYVVFGAWCFYPLRGDTCTAEACLSCPSSTPFLPTFNVACAVEEMTSSQHGSLVYRIFCYVTEDNCTLVSTSSVEGCTQTIGKVGCYCSLHMNRLNFTQDENGSLTAISGSAALTYQAYGFSMCASGLIITELCETTEFTTQPLLDFLSDEDLLISCRCFGTNCSRNMTLTINVQQPDLNSLSTPAVPQFPTATKHSFVASQMVFSPFPTSTILASSSNIPTSSSSAFSSPSGGLAGCLITVTVVSVLIKRSRI